MTTDRAVAARCAKPIVIGPGSTITPFVLGPGAVPVITDPEAASSDLSELEHWLRRAAVVGSARAIFDL